VTTRAEVIRNTLFSSVGTYTEYFLGMLVSIIIARHLGPGDFGTYSLVVWLVACGVIATNAGSTTTMIKFIAELRGSGAIVHNNRVVDDGNVITSGGLSAGLDLGLWLIEREVGPDLARAVADILEYRPHHDVWQSRPVHAARGEALVADRPTTHLP
jgi:hypothetical protein